MKNIIITVLTIGFYLFIYIIFLNVDYKIEYIINYENNKFIVKEDYDGKLYKINILYGNDNFNFKIFNNFKNQRQIVKKIYFYENETYKCMIPIFKDNESYTDFVCYDGEYHLYQNMEEKEDIENFILNIKEYNKERFIDIDKGITKDNITYYNLNINPIYSISNYKGIYVFNKGYENIKLFNNDIYDAKLSGYVNKYYFIADYNEKYSFHKIYIYDYVKNKKYELISPYEITFNSYIQGVYDEKVYLYDVTNRKQYIIDLNKKEVKKNNKINIYKNNQWIDISPNEAEDIVLFSEISMNDSDYERIDTTEEYIYYYKKINNMYNVYRADNDKKVFLFKTATIDRVKYKNDLVYFIDNNILKQYSDRYGVKKICYFKELEFNKDIKFGIY